MTRQAGHIVDSLNAKYDLGRKVLLVPIKCSTVTPFTVTISGGATAVPAKRVSGQTFAATDTGMAFWAPPLPPICFKTT